MSVRKRPVSAPPSASAESQSGATAAPGQGSSSVGGSVPGSESVVVGAAGAGADASRLISMRVPVPMLEALRRHAKRRAMPYQSLLKHWLAERLEEEGERQARHQAAIAQGRPLVR